ncbi:MAG: galactose-1-phosphate uridylyltransferase, partial [Clostridia bacterium]|nr:galactose-1-phosphate uridylyltransferase [Clostridia bacterium]
QDELRIKLSQLVAYAGEKISLNAANTIYVTNQLLDLFSLTYPAPIPEKYEGDFQTELVDPIVDYAVAAGMTKDEERLLFETKLLGIVTPSPAEIIEQFDIIAGNSGCENATSWLYNLGKSNNYIRMVDINKNVKWEHEGKFGGLEITINLSKPEKDPKQIAAAKLLPKTGYPACLLCPENVGFAGNLNHPARQTLRTIPIELDGEAWDLQYSPYQYYKEHVIAFCKEHRPMKVDDNAIRRLMDFVDIFPHYFIGSNAALPIVGGSILTHDHYQGGAKVLPMMSRGLRKRYKCKQYSDVCIGIADWYNSVVRIEGSKKEDVYNVARRVLNTWFMWSDESVGVISKTDEQHNAITPICRYEDGKYIFDLILRNNRT